MIGQSFIFGGIAGGAAGTEVSYLVIAGGAGGGNTNGYTGGMSGYGNAGGGGAGGYRNSYASETSGANGSTETPLNFTSGTTYTITVGGGGSAMVQGTFIGYPGPYNYTPGGSGGNSSISGADITTITSIGGGGGNTWNFYGNATFYAGDGGCGGGVGAYGTRGDGTNVTNGDATNQGMNGGGGGTNTSGDGGGASSSPNGLYSSITGSSVPRAGGGMGADDFAGYQGRKNANVYGGGQGGGTYTPTGSFRSGGNGVNNKGGGGGGKSYRGAATSLVPGNGGSGVVILRMSTSEYSGTQSGASVTTDGSDTILTFNGSGSYTH